MKRLNLFSVLSFLLFFPLVAQAATVTSNVTDTASLKAALSTASSNGADNIINLAAGTYTVSVTPFGFSSAQTTSISLVGAGAGLTVLDGAGSLPVLSLANAGDVHVSGITVQNGNNTGAFGGGAFFVSNGNGSVSVTQSAFSSNTSTGDGAGLVVETNGTGSITLTGNSITNNHATSATSIVAGVVAIASHGNISFSENTVSNNQDSGDDSASPKIYGSAGFYLNGAALTVTHNTIQANQATFDVGGGHIEATSGLVFTNNTVKQNTAVKNFGGLLVHVSNGDVNFSNNIFENNTATLNVGALNLAVEGSGTTTFNANQILNNTSSVSSPVQGVGGATLVLSSAQNFVTNNLVAGNQAPSATYAGLAVASSNGVTTDIANNTITHNTAGVSKGGLGVGTNNPADVMNIYNNIVYANTAPAQKDIFIHQNAGSTIKLFNNDFSEVCFDGGACDASVLAANQGGNINLDPLFVNAAGGDFSLQATSPLLNEGSATAPGLPLTDLDANTRVSGSAPDLGAIEYTPSASSGSGGGCSLQDLPQKNNLNYLVGLLFLFAFSLGLRARSFKRVKSR